MRVSSYYVEMKISHLSKGIATSLFFLYEYFLQKIPFSSYLGGPSDQYFVWYLNESDLLYKYQEWDQRAKPSAHLHSSALISMLSAS